MNRQLAKRLTSLESNPQLSAISQFYVWTHEELKQLLSAEELKELNKNFAISENGNFEHGQNILALALNFDRKARSNSVKRILEKLFLARSKRIRPHRDDKVITAWNGLFIAALAKAGAALGEKRYIDSASKAAQFLLERNRDKNGKLLRRWIHGESKFEGHLEDYALFIDALIELFQATSETRWLKAAESLQALQEQLFYDLKGGAYFSSAGDKHLIQRKREFEDNVVPAGNSVTVLNLLRLAAITFNQDYLAKAEAVLKSLPEATRMVPSGFPQLLMAIDYKLDQSKEIAIVAEKEDSDFQKVRDSFLSSFMPNKVIGFGISSDNAVALTKNKKPIQGKPTVYVCVNRVCQLPTNDLSRARKLADSFKKYQMPSN